MVPYQSFMYDPTIQTTKIISFHNKKQIENSPTQNHPANINKQFIWLHFLIV